MTSLSSWILLEINKKKVSRKKLNSLSLSLIHPFGQTGLMNLKIVFIMESNTERRKK
jgi:hypothetical protein